MARDGALARMEAIGARVASLQAALASTPASAAAAGWNRALSLDVAASGGRGWPWVAPGPASPGGAAQDVSPPVLAPSPRGLVYPLAARGKIIGLPYQGTHAQLPGWESRNAVDIAVPYGTPVYAVADGVIEGITLLDNPSNPNHPSIFHVRDDGWMGASLTYAEPLDITKEQPLTLRYRFWIHTRWCDLKETEAHWNRWSHAVG